MKLLMLMILFYGISAETDPEELVSNMLDKFDTLATGGIEIAEKLKLIKEVSSSFLKFGVPFGGVIVAAMEIADKPDSKEYKALVKLSTSLDVGLHKLENQIKFAFDVEELDREMTDFQNHVTVLLDTLFKHIRVILDPKKDKTKQQITDFVGYCRSTNSIENIASYMALHTKSGCSLGNTHVFHKSQALWNTVATEYGISEWKGNERFLRNKITHVFYTSEQGNDLVPQVEHKIKNLTKGSLEEKMLTVYEDVKERGKSCLTDAVFNGSKWNRIRIAAYATYIQTELCRLMLAANVCSGFMYNEDSSRESFLERVNGDVQRISSFLVEYLPQKLNMSGFEAEDSVILDTVKEFKKGRGSPDITLEDYQELAQTIQKTLEEYGPESMRRQVLISHAPNDKDGYEVHYECPSFWCSTLLDIRGVDCVVFRMEANNIVRSYDLSERVETIKKPLNLFLESHYREDIHDILDNIKASITDPYTNEWQRSFGLVIRRTGWLSTCNYPAEIADYRYHGKSATGTIYFSNSGKKSAFFHYNTCFMFAYFM